MHTLSRRFTIQAMPIAAEFRRVVGTHRYRVMLDFGNNECDWPVQSGSGEIHYANPERVPDYAQTLTREAFDWLARQQGFEPIRPQAWAMHASAHFVTHDADDEETQRTYTIRDQLMAYGEAEAMRKAIVRCCAEYGDLDDEDCEVAVHDEGVVASFGEGAVWIDSVIVSVIKAGAPPAGAVVGP